MFCINTAQKKLKYQTDIIDPLNVQQPYLKTYSNVLKGIKRNSTSFLAFQSLLSSRGCGESLKMPCSHGKSLVHLLGTVIETLPGGL